jgi:hypothetical protein
VQFAKLRCRALFLYKEGKKRQKTFSMLSTLLLLGTGIFCVVCESKQGKEREKTTAEHSVFAPSLPFVIIFFFADLCLRALQQSSVEKLEAKKKKRERAENTEIKRATAVEKAASQIKADASMPWR